MFLERRKEDEDTRGANEERLDTWLPSNQQEYIS